jgi:two-component system catabolic regulation response regulator CreB
MVMKNVLLIDDEPAITESLAFALERVGFETRTAHTLSQANEILARETVSLVVLDIMLPDGNGLDWLRELRSHSQLPVIILSSHDETVDHIVGLELGADDYMDKPFSPRELAARVRAVLRRLTLTETSIEDRADGLNLDTEKRLAWVDDANLPLSRIEFDLLHVFLGAPGRVFERGQLLDRVWGPNVSVTERTIDVHIKTLRKKLVAVGLPADTIETVRGIGYRLSEEH